jgi:hypothetical protein
MIPNQHQRLQVNLTSKALGNIIRDVHPGSGFDFLPIPDSEVLKAPDLGSATLHEI